MCAGQRVCNLFLLHVWERMHVCSWSAHLLTSDPASVLPLLTLPEGEGRVGKLGFLLLMHFYLFLVCLCPWWFSVLFICHWAKTHPVQRSYYVATCACLLLSLLQDFRGFAVFAISWLRGHSIFWIRSTWVIYFITYSHCALCILILVFVFRSLMHITMKMLWFPVILHHSVILDYCFVSFHILDSMSFICFLLSGGWVSDRWTWMVRRRD